MLLFEPLFLFVFLPAIFAAYLLVGRSRELRTSVLLGGSVLFYTWGEPRFVPVLLASCAVDFVLCRIIVRSEHRPAFPLAIGVAQNVAMLVYYKYTNFLVYNFDILGSWVGARPLDIAAIMLPIGVSFVVFEKITYLVDVSRRVSQPSPDFWTYRPTTTAEGCQTAQIVEVGGSFLDQLNQALSATACPPAISHWFYFQIGHREFNHAIASYQPGVDASAIALRTAQLSGGADIVVLEENEQVIARSGHARLFMDMLLGASGP